MRKMMMRRATMVTGLYSMLGLLVFLNVRGMTTRCLCEKSMPSLIIDLILKKKRDQRKQLNVPTS